MADKRKPGEVYGTDLPDAQISFDIEAFDELARSQGVTFIHWRAMRCPVGMVDQHDSRRPHDDHSGCSNGFLYTYAGKITCLFSGNSTQVNATTLGNMDGSSVMVTFPRYYDNTEETVYVAPYDRLYLDEERIVVPHWQLFTTNGIKDRLQFPAVMIQDLVDNQNIRYQTGDYEIREGHINWLTSKRPGLDPETGLGRVCSVRFNYRPYWYIKSLIHEVRVSQAENIYTGVREIQRMPQAAQLQREYIFEGSSGDKDTETEDPRNARSPDGIRYGPR